MLETLRLTFQGHEDASFDLNAPIVSFVGPSDSGKSSALRGLRWLCLGQAPRSAMAPWGTDKVRAKLTVDGRTVERRKSKSENVYVLGKKTFAAVGQGTVPDEVSRMLNVDACNFQAQHSSHFWLADTPGEVARQLNAAVNLDLIDKALANVASELRDARHTETLYRQQLTDAEERAESLRWAEDADRELKVLEGIETLIEAGQQESEELAGLVREGKKAEEFSRTALAECTQREKALAVLGRIVDQCGHLVAESERIHWLLEDVRCKTEKANELRIKAERLEGELAKIRVCPTCSRPL